MIGWLVCQQWMRGILYRLTDPYGHLYNTEGELYMGRWVLVERGSRVSKLLSWLSGGRYDHVRVHWIGQPDRDRELHDHPFNYRTFVLAGWYIEEYIPADTLITGPSLRAWQGSTDGLLPDETQRATIRRTVRPGMSAAAPLGQFHRIAEVSKGGVWTLFCMGTDHGKWGFLVNGRWVRSHSFFKLRAIGADGRKA
jgi:hypothetical protein